MPELPEVEFGRKVAAAVVTGRVIEALSCAHDPIVYEGRRPSELEAALRGRRVVAVARHGKHLWFELDRRPWITFHFGMTGAFRVDGSRPIALAHGPRAAREAWPPRFTKLRLHLDDGGELIMTSARRLARIRLRDDPRAEPPIASLGFDPLLEMPTLDAFSAALGRRRASIKGCLLDQRFAAGVGNWIADEVAYQAGVDPRRRASSLAPGELAALHRSLREVVETAVAVDADADRFPAGWLFHHRWGRRATAQVDGAPVRFDEVAGRTTAWVPGKQR